MRRLLAALAAVAALTFPAAAGAQATDYPDSMASTGDSITRAFNTGLPSLEGQRVLAEVTWNAGPFAG